MQIKDVMTPNPLSCRPDANLAAVTKLLWNGDCGIVPVTDSSGKVLGMLTDRDVCVALGTRNVRAADVPALEAMSLNVFSCQATDDVRHVLNVMKTRRVRRLPVVDAGGHLIGLVSMNDIILAVGKRPKELTEDDVVSTLQGLCAHRPAKTASAA